MSAFCRVVKNGSDFTSVKARILAGEIGFHSSLKSIFIAQARLNQRFLKVNNQLTNGSNP